jgi:hypothetical protein
MSVSWIIKQALARELLIKNNLTLYDDGVYGSKRL